MVSNFTVCRNFSQSALHCYHHSQNTLLLVFIQYWNCFNFCMEFVCLSIHILAILWHCMINNFRFIVRSRWAWLLSWKLVRTTFVIGFPNLEILDLEYFRFDVKLENEHNNSEVAFTVDEHSVLEIKTPNLFIHNY